MNVLTCKTIFIQKPYYLELSDDVYFRWVYPEKLRALDYYTANYFRDVRRGDAADVIRVYSYLITINGLLPKGCSHDWLHRYLLTLSKQGFVKIDYAAFNIKTFEDLLKVQQWPGVTSDVYTRIGSTVAVPKFYGIDSYTPAGLPVYDANLNIFATAVP